MCGNMLNGQVHCESVDSSQGREVKTFETWSVDTRLVRSILRHHLVAAEKCNRLCLIDSYVRGGACRRFPLTRPNTAIEDCMVPSGLDMQDDSLAFGWSGSTLSLDS